MGKRKARKPPPPKKVVKLATRFNCPFCNASCSVTGKVDKDRDIGTVRCEECGQGFSARVTALSDPIDIYHAWIDACEETEHSGSPLAPTVQPRPVPAAVPRNTRQPVDQPRHKVRTAVTTGPAGADVRPTRQAGLTPGNEAASQGEPEDQRFKHFATDSRQERDQQVEEEDQGDIASPVSKKARQAAADAINLGQLADWEDEDM